MKAATLISTRQFDSVVEDLLTPDERIALEFAVASNPEAHPMFLEPAECGKCAGRVRAPENAAAFA